MSAIDVMKEKNVLLEKSLSAETRLKLDLFSALGERKRQLEITHSKSAMHCSMEVNSVLFGLKPLRNSYRLVFI